MFASVGSSIVQFLERNVRLQPLSGLQIGLMPSEETLLFLF